MSNLDRCFMGMRSLLLALVLCFPVAVFHRIPMFKSGGTAFFGRVYFPLALIFCLYLLWKKSFPKEAFFSMLKVVSVWVLASIILALYHMRSGFSGYITYPLMACFIFAALQGGGIKLRHVYLASAGFTLATFVLQCIDTFYVGNHEAGLGGNHVTFAHGCTFFIGATLFALFDSFEEKDSLWLKVLYAVSSLGGLGLLYITGTRGAHISVMALLLFSGVRGCKSKNKYVISLVLCLLCIAVAVTYQRLNIGLNEINAYIEKGNGWTSWGTRLKLWEISLKGMHIHPLLGWGPEPLANMLKVMHIKDCCWDNNIDFHSDYFNMLATGGFLLIGAYATIMVGFIKLAWGRRRTLWTVVNVMILGVSNCAFTESRSVEICFLLLFILFYWAEGNEEQNQETA